MDLKIGDKVVIRQWEDMQEEFGLDESGDIKCTYGFTKEMKPLCGKTLIIYSIIEYNSNKKYLFAGEEWSFSEDMFEKTVPVKERIIAFRQEGEKVHCFYKENGTVKSFIFNVDEVSDIFKDTKKLFDNMDLNIENWIGKTLPKGSVLKIKHMDNHKSKSVERVCIDEYVGKTFITDEDYFIQNRHCISGKFEKEYMNAIDKENGYLLYAPEEVELISVP